MIGFFATACSRARCAPSSATAFAPDGLRARACSLVDSLLDKTLSFDRHQHRVGSIERIMRRILRARFGWNFQFETSARSDAECEEIMEDLKAEAGR